MGLSRTETLPYPAGPTSASRTPEVDASHFRALFEQSLEAIVLTTVEGTVLAANGSAGAMFRRDRDELVGLSMRDLVNPGDDRVHAALATRRRTGRFAGRLTLRRANGTPFEAEITSTVFSDDAGRLLTYLFLRDVSEPQAALRAVESSAHRYRALVETTGSVLIGIAPDGTVMEWNREAERLFGYARSEVMGGDFLELLTDPVRREEMREQVARVMAGETPRPREDAVVSRTGDQRVVVWSLTRLLDVSSRPIGVIASGHDITERKQLEAQMQHAQKLESLGVLAGGIAHDFNNLLVGILGNASLALMDIPAESELHELIRDVETAALRAADLTTQMLAYSGRGRFVVRPLDLSALVTEMAQLLHAGISKKAILRFAFAEGLPSVEADATQLRQIVMNLITNASDALNDEVGTITLRTGRTWADRDMLRSPYLDYEPTEGEYAFVEVVDSGTGMTPETMQRIFDPFFSTKFTGRGLGLAATLGIVRGHRGSLAVESAPGHGTTFRVLLPVAPRAESAQRESIVDVDGVPGEGLVLVIDDDPAVRTVAGQMLERRGFRVLVAADGLEGLDLFHQHRDEVRLALIDLTMPRMGGEELVAAIRAVEPDLPLVLMSGFSEMEVADRFRLTPITACIQKPFRVEELDRVVGKADGSRKS